MFTDEDLIDIYQRLDMLKKEFKQNKNYCFDMMPQQFFLRVRQLKTQVYGLRVQGYFAYHLDFDITPSSWDCGDFKDSLGQDIEFKCSFIDNDSQNINVKQIRLWQPLDYYYIMTIDYRDYTDIKYNLFILDKEEMIKECEIINACAVANTKEHTTDKSSLGFSIKENTEHFERWQNRYLNNKFNINKVVSKSLEKQQTIRQQQLLNSLTNFQNRYTISATYERQKDYGEYNTDDLE